MVLHMASFPKPKLPPKHKSKSTATCRPSQELWDVHQLILSSRLTEGCFNWNSSIGFECCFIWLGCESCFTCLWRLLHLVLSVVSLGLVLRVASLGFEGCFTWLWVVFGCFWVGGGRAESELWATWEWFISLLSLLYPYIVLVATGCGTVPTNWM